MSPREEHSVRIGPVEYRISIFDRSEDGPLSWSVDLAHDPETDDPTFLIDVAGRYIWHLMDDTVGEPDTYSPAAAAIAADPPRMDELWDYAQHAVDLHLAEQSEAWFQFAIFAECVDTLLAVDSTGALVTDWHRMANTRRTNPIPLAKALAAAAL